MNKDYEANIKKWSENRAKVKKAHSSKSAPAISAREFKAVMPDIEESKDALLPLVTK